MYTQIEENIYSIYVPLPENPLRNLNSYLIKGEGGRSLLIDTAFAGMSAARRCSPGWPSWTSGWRRPISSSHTCTRTTRALRRNSRRRARRST